MFNILVVDDLAEFKVSSALNYLKNYGIKFKCEYEETVNEANCHIKNHSDSIHLIILDLGLPLIQGGDYTPLNGLYVLQFMKKYNIKIPVIINSSTAIPNEQDLLEECSDTGLIVEHVSSLEGDWLKHFIFNTIIKNHQEDMS